jgi:anti-sigma regulatory factor (Ser/Thr protein kinase)
MHRDRYPIRFRAVPEGKSPHMPVYPAEPRAIREIRAFAQEALVRADVPEDAQTDLLLAISEAASNAVQHSGSPSIEVRLSIGEECVEVAVRDRGIWSTPDRRGGRLRAGGYGLPIITATMNQVRLTRGTANSPGTTVWLVRNIAV